MSTSFLSVLAPTVKALLQECPSALKLLKRYLLAGAPKTVEFDFDLAADTAYSVANEMVSDLSLSHDDAKVLFVKPC